MTDVAIPDEPVAEAIGECRVMRNIRDLPAIDTVEGRMIPVMGGIGIRTHIIEMPPGMYTPAHPHPTESLIYTLAGRWVFCTTENDEEVRTVINAGDMFHFMPDVPTGFETPFDETAVILILKGDPGTWQEMWSHITKARDSMAKAAEEGEPIRYDQLPEDHPARIYGAKVAGADPVRLNTPAS